MKLPSSGSGKLLAIVVRWFRIRTPKRADIRGMVEFNALRDSQLKRTNGITKYIVARTQKKPQGLAICATIARTMLRSI